MGFKYSLCGKIDNDEIVMAIHLDCDGFVVEQLITVKRNALCELDNIKKLILSKSDASDDAPGDAPGDVGPPKFIYGEFCGYNSGGLKFIFYSHEKGGMTYFVIKNKERIIEFINFVVNSFG